MASRTKDRRKFQRITLFEPVVGRFGANRVLILDLAVTGASIESSAQFKAGDKARLTFTWDRSPIAIEARVIRCKLRGFSTEGAQTVYQSGVVFTEGVEESVQLIRKVIAAHVRRALAEQKANARGIPIDEVEGTQVGLEEFSNFLRSRTDTGASGLKKTSGYVSFTLDKGVWKKRNTKDPVQPAEGFTISESDAGEEGELLCKTYEQMDPEWRKVLRLFAELSVTESESISARRFKP